MVNLTDGLAVELSQPDSEKQRVKDHQCDENRQYRQVRELRQKRALQTLAGVNERIHQDGLLQDGKV